MPWSLERNLKRMLKVKNKLGDGCQLPKHCTTKTGSELNKKLLKKMKNIFSGF